MSEKLVSLNELPPDQREKFLDFLLKHNASFVQESGHFVTTVKVKRKSKTPQHSDPPCSQNTLEKTPKPPPNSVSSTEITVPPISVPSKAQSSIEPTPRKSTNNLSSLLSSEVSSSPVPPMRLTKPSSAQPPVYPPADPPSLSKWAHYSEKYTTFCKSITTLSDAPDPSNHCASMLNKCRKRAATWLKRHIDGVYESFWTSHCRSQQRATTEMFELSGSLNIPLELPKFCLNYLQRTLGLQSLVLQALVEFLVNLNDLRAKDADIELFANFFEEFYSMDALLILLTARSTCGKVTCGSKIAVNNAIKGIKLAFKHQSEIIGYLTEKIKKMAKNNQILSSHFDLLVLENITVAKSTPNSPEKPRLSPITTALSLSKPSPIKSPQNSPETFGSIYNCSDGSNNSESNSVQDSFASRVRQLQLAKEQLKLVEQQQESPKKEEDDDVYSGFSKFSSQNFTKYSSDTSPNEENFEPTYSSNQISPQLEDLEYQSDCDDVIDQTHDNDDVPDGLDPDEIEMVSRAAEVYDCSFSREFAISFLSNLESISVQYCTLAIKAGLDYFELSRDYFEPVYEIIYSHLKEAVAPLAALSCTDQQFSKDEGHSDHCFQHLMTCQSIFQDALNVTTLDELNNCTLELATRLLASPEVRNRIEPTVAYIIANVKHEEGIGSPSLLFKSRELQDPTDDVPLIVRQVREDSDEWLDLASEAALVDN
ncbi:hypothetical protein RCL1_002277 [Eukaryota sp. TZLM3-RCL]